MGEIEYQEIFERSGYATIEDAQNKINAVIEAHPMDLGWSVGKPEITRDADGTFKVAIPLTKYAVREGRSR